MVRVSVALSCLFAALATAAPVLAEGTDELMPSVGAAGRLGLVDTDAPIYADVLRPDDEVLCALALDSTGDPVTFDIQTPDAMLIAAAVPADGRCTSLAGFGVGAYRLVNMSRGVTSTRRWDISVCDTTASAGTCDASAGNPAHVDGRVFAYRWVFNSTSTQSQSRAVRASVYARVAIGAFGSGVVELQVGGVHGLARWELLANSAGITGVNPSRSTREGRTVATEYPIYFNLPDPEVEAYGVPNPNVSGLSFSATGEGSTCGVVEPSRNEARFTFTANMPGRYRLICDLNDDGGFDAAGDGDLVVDGEANVGSNMLVWNGRDVDGDVMAGEYPCIVELNAGEFHYVAEDIEVAYPGLRMFQVAPNLVRTPLPMFWNDGAVIPAAPIVMPNGDLPQTFSPAGGLSSGPYADAAAAHGVATAGNARGWGNFVMSGSLTGSRGDGNLMDTWTGLETVRSAAVMVRIVGQDADCDGTGGTDFEELCITNTDPCACDIDAHCSDGVDCTSDSCNGGECRFTSLPRGAECAGGRCDGESTPMCEMCLTSDDCPGDLVCVEARCVGDDDDMDTIANLVECPDLRAGGVCPDTDEDGRPDYQDPDDDEDSIPTRDEVEDGDAHGNDVDGDMTLNWHDTDSDGDGRPDRDEGRGDDDGDGVPDYLDPDPPMGADAGPGMDAGARDGGPMAADAGPGSDGGSISIPPPPATSGVTGGALCTLHGEAPSAGWMFGLLALVLLRRRSRSS